MRAELTVASAPAPVAEPARPPGDTAQGDDRRVTEPRVAAHVGAGDEYDSDLYARGGRLQIEKDTGSAGFIYRIVDERTGETIRQWPSEDVLRRRDLADMLRGVILDRRI